MFIIFNKGALMVALIALIFLSPVVLLWKYHVLEEDTALLAGSWLLFTASLIALKMKVKDRLFYLLPTWVFTLPCALYASFHFFGKVMSFAKIVFLIFVSIVLFIVILAFIVLFISEKKRKRDLEYFHINIPEKSDGILNYWKGIRDLFFFPLFYKWTDEIYDYNIRVLQHLNEHDVKLRYSNDFSTELVRMKNCILNGETQHINNKIKNDFFSEIEYQIKTWQSN